MPVFKRSELTADTLKQWEMEAAGEWILETAQSAFDLSMAINGELCADGRVLIEGQEAGRWRKQGDKYIHYLPGSSSAGQVKIIRGPWN